jgi:hypothetical protein
MFFLFTAPLKISACLSLLLPQIDELRAAVVAARAKERDADARARVFDHKNLEAAAREENLQKNLAKNLDEFAAYKAEAEREMNKWREECDRCQGEAENAREELELQTAEVCVFAHCLLVCVLYVQIFSFFCLLGIKHIEFRPIFSSCELLRRKCISISDIYIMNCMYISMIDRHRSTPTLCKRCARVSPPIRRRAHKNLHKNLRRTPRSARRQRSTA